MLISKARPASAIARMAARNPSSKWRGSNGPADATGQDRARLRTVAVTEGEHVEGPVDAVDRTTGEQGGSLSLPEVRLPELDAGQDAKLRILPAAPVNRRQIAIGVEGGKPHVAGLVDILLRVLADVPGVDPPSVLEVEVLGEHDGGKPYADGPLTGPAHRPHRSGIRSGIPRPLAMDMRICGQGDHLPESIPDRRPRQSGSTTFPGIVGAGAIPPGV